MLWGRVLLSQACSLWYMVLPAHLHSQWNKVEVLSQAMELLAALRSREAHPSDEVSVLCCVLLQSCSLVCVQVCYRVLMDQCMEHGRPALAVRVYSDMRKAGIQPSAVTYAFYNKAMMEGSWPSTKRRWKILKIVIIACLHLCWLQRRHNQEEGQGRGRKAVAEGVGSWCRRTSSECSDLTQDVEGEDNDSGHSLLQRRRSSGRLHRSSVYRLSKHQVAGDYAVKEGAFYMADKLPPWGRMVEEEGEEPAASRWWLGGRSRYSFRQVASSAPLWASREERGGMRLGVEVVMSSCSQCPHCRRLLYDEEVMICWSEGAGDYSITCSYCQGPLVPSLSIRMSKVWLLVSSLAECGLCLHCFRGCQRISDKSKFLHQTPSIFLRQEWKWSLPVNSVHKPTHFVERQ